MQSFTLHRIVFHGNQSPLKGISKWIISSLHFIVRTYHWWIQALLYVNITFLFTTIEKYRYYNRYVHKYKFFIILKRGFFLGHGSHVCWNVILSQERSNICNICLGLVNIIFFCNFFVASLVYINMLCTSAYWSGSF